MIILNLLVSVIAWFVLSMIGANLLGFFVRGLFKNSKIDRLIDSFALILIVVYLYLLFHFLNIGVMVAAVMLMAGRLPDLLWEIKYGKKTTLLNLKARPKNALYFLIILLDWGALPVLYYSLFYL